MASPSSSRTCRFPTFSPMRFSSRSGRAACAVPTCSSSTGISASTPTSRRRSRSGHEITGVVHKIGGIVPEGGGIPGGRSRGRRAGLGRWHLPSLPGRQHAHLPERALAGVRAVWRIRGVHARSRSLPGQGGPPPEVRGARAAHRCRPDALSRHQEAARRRRARPRSRARRLRHRRAGRIRRSVRQAARRRRDGRRVRPQCRQARRREGIRGRPRHQHQGQVRGGHRQGTRQGHGPGATSMRSSTARARRR